ncbi:MAG: CDC48 family AAA ATPase [bacterium]|nr:CDC48 family AAA ATPase [bacterium]
MKVKVAEALQPDVGKGVVRLGSSPMRQLGLDEGGIVEIRGKRVTAAVVLGGYAEDEGLDIVRMDGLVRGNAQVGIGETTELAAADWEEAESVRVAPAREGLRLGGTGEALRSTLLHRPLVQGDLISTSVFKGPPKSHDQRPDELLRGLFESRAFGLMEIRLVVHETKPEGVVRVTEATQIELLPEYSESDGRTPHDVTYDDIGGMKSVLQKLQEMVELPLKHPELFARLGIDPPSGVLLHGPPGTGKTLLAKAVANESDAHFSAINGPEIMGKFYGESEERLRGVFAEAEKNAPAIVFIDEIDSIAPKRSEVTGETERRIVAQLLTLMDGLRGRRSVMVIGATNRVDAIDPALRRPGRFDREIDIGIPDRNGRQEILQIHTRGMPLAKDVEIDHLADVTHGFTGSDIAALAKEAALATLRRVMPTFDFDAPTIPSDVLDRLEVLRLDFDQALREVQPSALREIVVEIPTIHWDDVGGLHDLKRTLHEMIELPLCEPEAFARLGIRAPKGVLLYGPPGTGKTMVARAVATEAGANFLATKGSSLLSKWYGESEKKIAEFFHRARQVMPTVLFFDELDSLAPVRGGSSGEPQVTERIVNQLLTEMDGMEELQGVVVLGATNRPDRVDPALLRPGRFDELVHVRIPDEEGRLEIFRAHTGKMALDSDFEVGRLASITERFTGADIAGVCMKAGLFALRDDPAATSVTMEHFFRAVKEAIPSVTPQMERDYERLARTVKQQGPRIGFNLGDPDDDAYDEVEAD